MSDYRRNLILKGGMLIASMVDVGQRLTRDTDVTLQGMTLDVESAITIARQIAAIPLDDATTFEIEGAHAIMEDTEYGGVRIEMRAHLDKSEIPMKLDISTGDALTPSAVNYTYHLMLEDRDIDILAYNVETVLAEKIETMLFRSTLNTRMRDFYDMWAIATMDLDIDYSILAQAIAATAETRGHDVRIEDNARVVSALELSDIMADLWARYQSRNDFVAELSWAEVLDAVRSLCDKARKSGTTSF